MKLKADDAATAVVFKNWRRDVDLDSIFVEFATLSGLSEDAVSRLRQLEEKVERESVAARPDVVSIMQFALSQGKRVVLASDMYLPRSVIESMLSAQGILGWHTLYLSSDIGLRKDSGDLYRHILEKEQVAPAQILMIGDNEHSDIQIPHDMGMNVWHVMRPVELARSIVRLTPLVDHALIGKDLNEELALAQARADGPFAQQAAELKRALDRGDYRTVEDTLRGGFEYHAARNRVPAVKKP